jgi:hypothetical protein
MNALGAAFNHLTAARLCACRSGPRPMPFEKTHQNLYESRSLDKEGRNP